MGHRLRTAGGHSSTHCLPAARTTAPMAAIGTALEGLGLTDIKHDEQRDGAELIGHVILARRP